MKNATLGMALAIATGFVVPTASVAQVPVFDASQITATCTVSTKRCQLLVAQIIRQLRNLGLQSAQINTQLAILAASIVRAAQSSPQTTRDLAETLTMVANASTDPAQSKAIKNVALLVATGQAGDIDITVAVAASPA